MSFSNEENELMKKCSKCGILQTLGSFYVRNDSQKSGKDCKQGRSSDVKNGIVITMIKLKSIRVIIENKEKFMKRKKTNTFHL